MEGIKYSNHVSLIYERDDSILSRFHSHILPILLAGILIFTLVDGLRFVCDLRFDRTSFPVSGWGKGAGLLGNGNSQLWTVRPFPVLPRSDLWPSCCEAAFA
jgi:hypothetical protein